MVSDEERGILDELKKWLDNNVKSEYQQEILRMMLGEMK